MAINFVNSIDLNKNELQNAVIQNVTANPSGGTYSEGQAAYNTNSNDLIIYNGSAWEQVGGSFTLRADGPSGANTFVVNPGSTVDLTGGTNMSVARGAGANSNVFTINTTATPDQTITLTGAVTGTGTGTFATTLQQVVDTSKFVSSAITKSDEDFSAAGEGSSGDSQVPTTKSVYNYVNLVATGNLKFMGGFNAATGAITSGPNSGGNITEDIAIAIGDYYVVTVSGNFYGTLTPAPSPAIPLTPGDNVIGTTARSAGATLSASDWSVVQADRDVATATTIGAGNTESGATSGIDVTYTNPSDGTATLSLDVNAVPASTDIPKKILGTDQSNNTKTFTEEEFFQYRFKKLTLNSSSAAIARAVAGGLTEYTIDPSNAAAFGGGASALSISVEVLDSSNGQTVYADITREDAAELKIIFTGTVADGAYDVLLTNLG